jgi:hypothetical protein
MGEKFVYNSENMQNKPGEKNPISISEARKIQHAISCTHLMTCDKVYCYLACPKWQKLDDEKLYKI